IVGGLLVFLKWRDKQRQKLAHPEQRVIRIWPHDRVGDIIIFGLIFGILGAKLFDNLENWDRFIQDPIKNLFAPSGLTFYGGLICAAIAICWFAKKKKINLWHLVDSAAPALLLAYAIGRIGCQVSGDGDWGVINSAYISDTPGHAIEASPGDFEKSLANNATYYLDGKVRDTDSSSSTVTDRTHKNLADVQHISYKAPAFFPTWFVAYTYPNNVNEDGVEIPGSEGRYSRALPLPVFPTPVYETLACTLLFLVLWGLRKRIKISGVIFALYLVFTGLERFFIELIRVNSEYHFFGINPSQAEIISVILIIAGFVLMFLRLKFAKTSHS
ncbi:MAG: prolipoprotein diacylglyceryl transferase family protein, partial [Chitinophagaceae bacterium]